MPVIEPASEGGAVGAPPDTAERQPAAPAGAPAEKRQVRERPLPSWLWYQFVRYLCAILSAVLFQWRASGQANLPTSGGALLICNHVSFLDVVFVAIPLRRPLNYLARSTLFVPVLAQFMRSVGGFPIQREGIGVSGMKETLRRVRAGGVVVLFPEGTRSRDGRLAKLKPGVAALAAGLRVPIVPAGLAGMFEVWPRSRALPIPHPVRIHYGPPILPAELAGLDTGAATELIRDRMRLSHEEACRALERDLTY